MVDIVQMRDIRLLVADQLFQFSFGLQRIHHPPNFFNVFPKSFAAVKVRFGNKKFGINCRQVIRMLHCERNHFVPRALQHA